MVEIMGGNLDKAFEQLGIKATKVVESESGYQVWQLSEEDFNFIAGLKDEDWKDDFGWWRSGKCIYEGTASVEYLINGEFMLGYEIDHQGGTDVFDSYTDWLNYGMNLSSDLNTVIFAESLASDNSMKLSEFIKKYEK